MKRENIDENFDWLNDDSLKGSSYQHKYLINVDLGKEGVDVPKVNRIIFARYTEVMRTLIQVFGRGARVSLFKSGLRLTDMSGSFLRFFHDMPHDAFKGAFSRLKDKKEKSDDDDNKQEMKDDSKNSALTFNGKPMTASEVTRLSVDKIDKTVAAVMADDEKKLDVNSEDLTVVDESSDSSDESRRSLWSYSGPDGFERLSAKRGAPLKVVYQNYIRLPVINILKVPANTANDRVKKILEWDRLDEFLTSISQLSLVKGSLLHFANLSTRPIVTESGALLKDKSIYAWAHPKLHRITNPDEYGLPKEFQNWELVEHLRSFVKSEKDFKAIEAVIHVLRLMTQERGRGVLSKAINVQALMDKLTPHFPNEEGFKESGFSADTAKTVKSVYNNPSFYDPTVFMQEKLESFNDLKVENQTHFSQFVDLGGGVVDEEAKFFRDISIHYRTMVSPSILIANASSKSLAESYFRYYVGQYLTPVVTDGFRRMEYVDYSDPALIDYIVKNPANPDFAFNLWSGEIIEEHKNHFRPRLQQRPKFDEKANYFKDLADDTSLIYKSLKILRNSSNLDFAPGAYSDVLDPIKKSMLYLLQPFSKRSDFLMRDHRDVFSYASRNQSFATELFKKFLDPGLKDLAYEFFLEAYSPSPEHVYGGGYEHIFSFEDLNMAKIEELKKTWLINYTSDLSFGVEHSDVAFHWFYYVFDMLSSPVSADEKTASQKVIKGQNTTGGNFENSYAKLKVLVWKDLGSLIGDSDIEKVKSMFSDRNSNPNKELSESELKIYDFVFSLKVMALIFDGPGGQRSVIIHHDHPSYKRRKAKQNISSMTCNQILTF